MLLVQENISLKQYNTFRIDVKAKWFASIKSEEELHLLFSDLRFKNVKKLIMGGGSNMLFTRDFDGLIIHIEIPGIFYTQQGSDIFVTAGAGVNWHSLVEYCVSHGFAGIENLSLIPGTAGASPVQNIGAYGVEIKDVLHSCTGYLPHSGEYASFTNEQCKFAYRDSIFKNELKGKVIITSVTYKLSTAASINTSYGAIEQELIKRNILNPGIADISKVVSEIRVSKLPDPSTIGNAGSFFKNPIISEDFFKKLVSVFPDMVYYCMPNSTVKLAAGWLIEQCGWKGRNKYNAGTWKNQSLVLVNHGNATGSDIYKLSEEIIGDVFTKFGITLEREVNVF